jgi:NAD(P)-dependent dehydrogenase (short-subunit alcohol dehydrogenase family)
VTLETKDDPRRLLSLEGKTALLTGGGGGLGSALALGLGLAGARVAVTSLHEEKALACAEKLRAAGIEAIGLRLDAFDKASIAQCADRTEAELGPIDILLNAAGGNVKDATVSPENSFFNLPGEAFQKVIGLNLLAGAIYPSQVIGERMVARGAAASIINVSSMNALRPLTRIAGYSAAKAAVSNFTQWLAVHLARDLKSRVRVNAIAPGFFLTEQNRFLLTDEKGDLTARGATILEHTPMGRFGQPEDLIGAAVWLASDASAFVTGVVLPIDGGFSAFSGV